MALDLAVRALTRFQLGTAAYEVYDFGRETVTKGFRPLNTSGLPVRALKLADTAVHGGAAWAHVVPGMGLIADVSAMMYGIAKQAIGKACEVKFGKGGLASDVKASGRLSMTAATGSLLSGLLAYAPAPGPDVGNYTGAAMHGALAAFSFKQFIVP